MRKPAQSEYTLLDVIRERWSPRTFSEESIPEKELYTLFESARWTPSCFNNQPWFYIYSTREEPQDFSRLLHCLAEQNQVWAKADPVLLFAIARRNFSTRNRENRQASHDLGMSLMNLILQATAQRIVAHPMAGFSGERKRRKEKRSEIMSSETNGSDRADTTGFQKKRCLSGGKHPSNLVISCN